MYSFTTPNFNSFCNICTCAQCLQLSAQRVSDLPAHLYCSLVLVVTYTYSLAIIICKPYLFMRAFCTLDDILPNLLKNLHKILISYFFLFKNQLIHAYNCRGCRSSRCIADSYCSDSGHNFSKTHQHCN